MTTSDDPNGSAVGVLGDDGLPYPLGISPGIAAPQALPPATPDTVICLRGPCRHYWRIETNVDYGNPAGTFEDLGVEEPRERNNRCTIQSGVEWDMAGYDVYDCNRWDPLTKSESKRLEKRREDYYKRFPEHDPEMRDVDVDVSTDDLVAASKWRRVLRALKLSHT